MFDQGIKIPLDLISIIRGSQNLENKFDEPINRMDVFAYLIQDGADVNAKGLNCSFLPLGSIRYGQHNFFNSDCRLINMIAEYTIVKEIYEKMILNGGWQSFLVSCCILIE